MKMLRTAVSLLVGSVAALTGTACSGGATTSADAHRLVSEGATLLDVRTRAEYAAGHVDGAVNVPVDEVSARMAEISPDAKVVVYCHSGGRSARAANLLRAAGYEVHDLGSMSAW